MELLTMCCPNSTKLGHSVELSFGDLGLLPNKRLSPSVEDFVRDNTDKGALHQETALADADDLFSGDGVQEFQKIPIKIGKTYLAEQLCLEGTVRQ